MRRADEALARALPSRTSMLRIQRDDVDADKVNLILQGHIVAEWADLLERECVELGRSGRSVTLDLSEVAYIGRSGFQALSRLSGAGVGIIGCSPLIADMLELDGIELNGKTKRSLK
jgi:anti-anti-sigma regulatory factor